jgi:hypothetical protein
MTAGGAHQTAAVEEFARELQDLRRAAGNPSFNDLAKVTGIPRSTLHDAVSGKRLASLKVSLSLVSALHGDVDEWRERWVDVDRARRPETSETASDLESDRPSWARRHRVAVLVAGVVVVAAGVAVPLAMSASGQCTQVRDYVVTANGAVLDDQGATVGQVKKGDHLYAKNVDHGRFAHRRYGEVSPGGTAGYVDESKLDFTGMTCT